jgi:integrase
MNLTVSTIAALKLEPGEVDRIWFDNALPGFGYRLRASGVATWIYQYKGAGRKTRRLTLGRATAIKPAKAREEASELYAKVRLGGDPLREKHSQRAKDAQTFAALSERYLAVQQNSLRPRSFAEVRRHIQKHAVRLQNLPVDTVDRRIIAELLSSIESNAGAVTANRAASSLSAMYGWAMREGLVDANPVIHTNRRPEKSRERVLGDAELATIWRALGDGAYDAIVKLLTLSGQRVSEIAGLRWSEVNLSTRTISLPGERTKNHRPHDVPISETMLAILQAQPKRGELVFGRGAGPFGAMGQGKAALDGRLIQQTGIAIPSWTHHDLRRTAATRMADIGVPPHIIEAVLNHVSGHKGGVAGIYNRSVYAAEKADALARWDDHIRLIAAHR